MTKVLIRKQLKELTSFLFFDGKKGKQRGAFSKISYSLLLIVIFGILLGMFYGLSSFLSTFVLFGLDWFYFTLMTIITIVLGVFGSVFNTYASVFLSKDNDLLLSMPIHQSEIILSRLVGVYVTGLFYGLLVFIPFVIQYYLMTGFNFASLIYQLIMLVVISFVILALSSLLGWVVAYLSVHLKNKSFLTVFISLAVIAIYYYFYFKVMLNMQTIIGNLDSFAQGMKANQSILYFIGSAFTGNIFALIVDLLSSTIAVGITFFLINESFIKITTMNKGNKKVVYNENSIQKSSLSNTLFKKELKRFTSSANYMLNCGFGTVFLSIAGIVMLIKKELILDVIQEIGISQNTVILLLIAMICLMSSMNDISTPSISLEGKSLWIYQSLPISGWDILKAKCKLHLVITLPAVCICTICFGLSVNLDLLSIMTVFVIASLYTTFLAMTGLMLGLLMPNFSWTNETMVIKQSANVAISLFGGWVIIMVFAALFYFTCTIVSATVFTGIIFVTLLGVNIVLYYWLKQKGCKKFEQF